MAERLTNDQRRFLNASMPVIERHYQFYLAQESEYAHKQHPELSQGELEAKLHAIRNMKYLTQLAIHMNNNVSSLDDLGDTAQKAGRHQDAMDCWTSSDNEERELHHVVETIMFALRPQG